MKCGFTLIEALVVLAVIAVIAVITFSGFLGGAHQADVSSTAQQIVASAREAQSNSTSQFKGMTWGIHFENATNTAPFYAVFTGNSYAAGTVESTYRLPADVAFVSSTLAPGAKIDVTFNPVSGVPSASTTIRIYSVASPSISSTIYIAGVGEISLGTTAYIAPPQSASQIQHLWIANAGAPNILELSATGTYLQSISSFKFQNPQGLTIDQNGNIWVADNTAAAVFELSPTGTYLTTVGSGTLSFPEDVAVAQNGTIWVDDDNNGLREFSATGTYLNTFTTSTIAVGGSFSIALDNSGNIWDAGGSGVDEFSATGTYLATFYLADGANGITVDKSGNLWVTTPAGVDELSPTDTLLLSIATSSVSGGGGISIDGSGNVWAVQQNPFDVFELSATGTYLRKVTSSQFSYPYDMTIY